MEQVFAVPCRTGIVDLAIPREDGVLVGQCTGETIEEICLRYPGVMLTTFSEATKGKEESFKTPPVEITEETFFEMLNCLPPVRWCRHGSTESFKMCEFDYGSITGTYARIDSRYFHMADSVFMSHSLIIEAIRKAFY